MGTRERRKREADELRRKILDAAAAILAEEGYNGLSIRKISARIEYSPAIVYHYFANKAEIVSGVVFGGYSRILKRMRGIEIRPDDPEATLLDAFRSYIALMLENPHLVRNVLMNDIGEAGMQIRTLDEGISEQCESIGLPANVIRRFIENGRFRVVNPELTAITMWCAVHGLLSRFILEPAVPPERQDLLLSHLGGVLVTGLAK